MKRLAPNSSHSSRTLALKSYGAGRVPDSGPSGSTTTAAVPPRAPDHLRAPVTLP